MSNPKQNRSLVLDEVDQLEAGLAAIKVQLSQPDQRADADWLRRVHKARGRKIRRLNRLYRQLRKMKVEREMVLAAIFMTVARRTLDHKVFDDLMDEAQKIQQERV